MNDIKNMTEDYKVKWEDITKIYNNRSLNVNIILNQLRELFEVEFFRDMVKINQEALDYRIANIKRKREKS